MAKTFLEAWLDATLGEMPQHGGDQLGSVKPFLGPREAMPNARSCKASLTSGTLKSALLARAAKSELEKA